MEKYTTRNGDTYPASKGIMIREFEKRADSEEFALITDSQEIKHVMESIGKGEDAQDYGLLFVKFGEGEYLEIWGSSGSVPSLNYHVYQVL